jgi:23S rRNA (uridine2552-2'-O)-methyltransferase
MDAGAAPGGWSQVLFEMTGVQGHVVAVDIIDIDGIKNPNFSFIKGDLFDENTLTRVLEVYPEYSVVVSDAAPNTSGQKFADHANSLRLVENIFHFSKNVLKENGNFLAKLFDGEDTKHFVEKIKKCFDKVSIYRPKSTRKNSFEIYIVCKGFKNDK